MSIDSVHFSNISLRLLVVLGLTLSSGCAMSEFFPAARALMLLSRSLSLPRVAIGRFVKIRAQEFAPWNMTQCV